MYAKKGLLPTLFPQSTERHLCGSAMFTGLGKKQGDTVLEMVVQVEMKSQKVEEGGKSVFYLPVMSSFITGFPVYRGASQGIFGRDTTGIRNRCLVREKVGCEWLGPSMNTLLTYCLWMNGGEEILQQVPVKSFFGSEAAVEWDFCSNFCEFGDRETGTHVTRKGRTESSSKFEELLLFKTSAYPGASKWD